MASKTMRDLRAYTRLMRPYLVLIGIDVAFSILWLADVLMPYSWIAFRVTAAVAVIMWLGDKRFRLRQSQSRRELLSNYRFKWRHVVVTVLVLLVAIYVLGAVIDR